MSILTSALSFNLVRVGWNIHICILRVDEAFDLKCVVHDLAIAEPDAEHVKTGAVGYGVDLECVFLGGQQFFELRVRLQSDFRRVF